MTHERRKTMNAITELEKRVPSLDSPCCTCEKSENCGSFKCWLYLKWPAIQSVLRKAGKENE